MMVQCEMHCLAVDDNARSQTVYQECSTDAVVMNFLGKALLSDPERTVVLQNEMLLVMKNILCGVKYGFMANEMNRLFCRQTLT